MDKKDFRIVFMGTPEFAVASLKALVDNNFNVVGVITSPDKPAGRGQKLNQSAVKKFASENNLYLLQPTNLKDENFLFELRELHAHLNIIVAFRMLPESVWSMPPMGSINLHGSLLPHYRGAAPINWVVINGESKTGVTTFFLKHEIDTGDILFQEELPIELNDNAGTIHDKLMKIGAKLIIKTTQAIIDENYTEIPQKILVKDELKPAPKIFKPDCQINWTNKTMTIFNLIRGLSPFPTAWSTLIDSNNNTTDFKVFSASPIPELHNQSPGQIISDGKTFINITTADGYISISELQLSGKKRMKTDDLLRGFKNIADYKLVY